MSFLDKLKAMLHGSSAPAEASTTATEEPAAAMHDDHDHEGHDHSHDHEAHDHTHEPAAAVDPIDPAQD